jgi:hypothetical protein
MIDAERFLIFLILAPGGHFGADIAAVAFSPVDMVAVSGRAMVGLRRCAGDGQTLTASTCGSAINSRSATFTGRDILSGDISVGNLSTLHTVGSEMAGGFSF